MGTERMEVGMLARSKAGHDKDVCYVIWKIDKEAVWLTDGRLRPLEKLKRKNKKHIQIIHYIPEEIQEKLGSQESIRNEDIKHAIKMYTLRGRND